MIYLYGFFDRRPSASRVEGVTGEAISLWDLGPIVLAAGEIDRGPALSRAALEKHDAVARALLELGLPFLPAAFCQTASDADALYDLVRPRAKALEAALERIGTARQMTLRLQIANSTAVTETERSSGAAYLRARYEDHRARTRAPELEALEENLHDLVRTRRVERDARGLSVYHLVEQEDVAAYLERTARGAGSLPFTTHGPSPAYAFCPGRLA